MKNLERQEVRDWLQNTREILEGEKKVGSDNNNDKSDNSNLIYHVFIKDILKGYKFVCNIRYDKKTIGKSWKGEGGLQIKPKIVLEIVQKDIKTF